MTLWTPGGELWVPRRPPIYHGSPSLFSGQGNIADDWALTINGTRVAPTGVWLPSDIDTGTGAWAEHGGDSDGDLTLQAGTPTYDVDSPFGVGGGDDELVTLDGASYWQAAGTSFGGVTTGDIVFEYFGVVSPAFGMILVKRAAGVGWATSSAFGKLYFLIQDASGSTSAVSAALSTAGDIVHAMCFLRRSEFAQWYVNRVASGTAIDISGRSLSLSNSDKLTIGASSSGSFVLTGTMGCAAIWVGTSTWLGTHLQADLAAERCDRWAGLYPQLSIPGAYAPTLTRATVKYYYRSSQSKSHLAGAGLLLVDDTGHLIEGAATNECLQSQDLATTWAKINAGDAINADSANDDTGEATLDGIAGDATDGIHGVSRDITLTAVAWVISFQARVGDKDWAYSDDTTVANAWAYFNVDGLAAGAKGAAIAASGIIDKGGGLVRCWYTLTGTAAAHTIRVAAANADSDNDFAGDGATSNVHLGKIQVELGVYPSGEIDTVAAAVTRNADDVELDPVITARLNTAGQGTIEGRLTLPNIDLANDRTVFSLNDGTGNEYIELKVAASGDQLEADMRSAAGADGDANVVADVADGAEHTWSLSWRHNRLSLIVDGVEAVDTACVVPAGVDELNIGRNNADGAYLDGHVTITKIYDYAAH